MFLRNLINIIYVKTCIICNKKINRNISNTCEKCSNILKYMKNEEIAINFENKFYDKLISIFPYEGLIRNRILDFKFNNKAYFGQAFSDIILESLLNNKIRADYIIPVPIHKKRFFERGYNQSEIMARLIGKKLKIKFESHILKKIINSKPQSTLKHIDRERNVLNTYCINNKFDLNEKRIILIDDVYTTGATVNECSRVLKARGVKEIIVVTISYVRRNFNG